MEKAYHLFHDCPFCENAPSRMVLSIQYACGIREFIIITVTIVFINYSILLNYINKILLKDMFNVDIIQQVRKDGKIMMDVNLCLEEAGKRIMQRRKKMGMTQEQLAEKSDVTTQFVSYAESGKRKMRAENLMKIAAALEVSADYLLTGDIIDKDKLLLSEKLDKLTPNEVRIIESIVDECIALYHREV